MGGRRAARGETRRARREAAAARTGRTTHARNRSDTLLVPGLIFVATVVALVSSLGAPLVPRIAQVQHVPVGDAQWSLTITLLVGAVATPLMGRLGDGPHRRADP